MARVLEVARSELARVGVLRLSIPEIAKRARVNKTSIYRRWPTKARLVRAALAGAVTQVEDAPDTGSLAGDLQALARAVADFIASPLGKSALRTAVADAKPVAMPAWGASLPAVLQRAVDRGELASDVDGSLMLFTIAGALMHRVLVERAPIDDDYLSRLVRLIERGVRPEPSPRSASAGSRPASSRSPH